MFVDQYLTEGADAPNLALPNRQDNLVERIAAANPRTVVVLETGGPVLMPWLDRTAAVLEAWYPGQKGGEAIAAILVGAVDPSGRLPVTFPANEGQLPRKERVEVAREGADLGAPPIVATSHEDAAAGYRRFAELGERPLFPFGFGLAYTTFRLGGLEARVQGDSVTATVEVTNTGGRAGAAVPQLYVTGPSGSGIGLRLAGWSRLALAPRRNPARRDRGRSATARGLRRVLASLADRAWNIHYKRGFRCDAAGLVDPDRARGGRTAAVTPGKTAARLCKD